jgi:tRNA(Ile)-lysidine synthase
MTIDVSKNISLRAPLIVAVSGGSDSVALLHLLRAKGFSQLIIAHLDHQLRQNSSQDAKFVKQLAKESGAKFVLKKTNIAQYAKKHRLNREDAGRQVRYDFFRTLKKKYKATAITTAHHGDDQIETILMNIVRGCGLDGLSGMQEIDGDLWRPLLGMSKKDILKYCRHQRLQFVNDSSNDDLQLRRNFLRKKVIPQLKKLNPQLEKTIQANAQLWAHTRAYLQEKAQNFLRTHQISDHRYSLKVFLSVPEFEQQIILRELFKQVHGHKKDLQRSHLDQILKILTGNVSGKQKEFGAKKIISKHRGWFEVQSM